MDVHRIVGALVLASLLLAGCQGAGGPNADVAPEDGLAEETSALRATLESVSRDNGVVTVVVVTTNSADTTQPFHLGAGADLPWLTDSEGNAVESTVGAHAVEIAVSGVAGHPLEGSQTIGPSGRATATAFFVDPGPGATVHYAAAGSGTPASRALTRRLE